MPFEVIDTIEPGDILRVKRDLGYYHFGIAISNNEVIHFSGSDADFMKNIKDVKIIKTDLTFFAKKDIVEKMAPFDSPYSREGVVLRANYYLGDEFFLGKRYNLINNNCEHFARYVYYGKHESYQANGVFKRIAAAAGIGITALGTYLTKKVMESNKNTND